MTAPGDDIYGFSLQLLDGTPATLQQFRGSVLLVVNTASKCGFTPQFAGLEQLYRTYREQGLVVLGFPCNQFGRQEPGSAPEIGAFCRKNYGVTFPICSKIEVNGPNAHPVYQFLKRANPGLLGFLDRGRIRWNFTKFLVNRSGHVVARFGSSTTPTSIAPHIEKLL